MDNFIMQLINGCDTLNISLTEKMISQFSIFYKYLLKWNTKINLTSINNEEEIIKKHFLDSLLIIKSFDFKKYNYVIDVGTGAGFPGLPIKIIYPHLSIVLLDSRKKKIEFLNFIINELKLVDTYPLQNRAETLAKDPEYRERFDISISRAVASLNTLVELSLPFIKIDGVMVAYKSKNISDELKNADNAIKELGGKVLDVSRETIPLTDIKRSFVFIKKEKTTPKKYPRRPGIPQKRPLL